MSKLYHFADELPKEIQAEIVRRYLPIFEEHNTDPDRKPEDILREKITSIWYSADCDEVIDGCCFAMDDLVPFGTFY